MPKTIKQAMEDLRKDAARLEDEIGEHLNQRDCLVRAQAAEALADDSEKEAQRLRWENVAREYRRRAEELEKQADAAGAAALTQWRL